MSASPELSNKLKTFIMKNLIFLFSFCFFIFFVNFANAQEIAKSPISPKGEITETTALNVVPVISSEQEELLNLMDTPYKERPTQKICKLLMGQEYIEFFVVRWETDAAVSGYLVKDGIREENPSHYKIKELRRSLSLK